MIKLIKGHSKFTQRPYKGWAVVRYGVLPGQSNSYCVIDHWFNRLLIKLKLNPR